MVLWYSANYEPQGTCDTGTTMTIDYEEMTATLRNFVQGMCDLHVAENLRTYKLLAGYANARHKRLHGVRETPAGTARLDITDYRQSGMMRPYDMFVNESVGGVSIQHMWHVK